MWKVLPVLAFIVFACDISRDVLVHGDPARSRKLWDEAAAATMSIR